MLARERVMTCFPGSPRAAAASAAACRTKSGSPFKSSSLLEYELESLFICQHILGERRLQFGQPGLDLLQPRFRAIAQPGAGPDEFLVIVLQELRLFGFEPELRRGGKKLVDPGEQFRVRQNRHAMVGEHGRKYPLDPLPLIVRVGGRQIEKNRSRLVEAPAARSRASMVFANVGAAGLFAIASTSARCSRIASSKAGRKSSSRIASKGGILKGVCQSWSRMFSACTLVLSCFICPGCWLWKITMVRTAIAKPPHKCGKWFQLATWQEPKPLLPAYCSSIASNFPASLSWVPQTLWEP